ncbi:unnamed protein product [Rotaria sordida]|uniref:protein kinase C n=1 Tax=Rotaria sordida TaxID=392033 RepID=A0A814QNT4_9BILA|nr:unnamed protein product [Rotaria sordida]CAF1120896.1 unnamed protein product [Rotaria sordida]
MENSVLQFRIISLKDSAKKNLDNTLFYIKKFVESPTQYGDTIKLEPSLVKTPIVISVNEIFDWNKNDGSYCQIICLTPTSKIIADIVLWFDSLLDIMNNTKRNEKVQSELPCSMTLKEEYDLQFSLQLIGNLKPLISSSAVPKKLDRHKKKLSRQQTQGHLMELKQFNQPVRCAVCDELIGGYHHQGFECLQCSLATHKKCHPNIRFQCQKSLGSVNSCLSINHPHTFKEYEIAFVRALVSRNCGNCKHCGTQIYRNALKCTQCSAIIHERCQSKISPICSISNDSPTETILKYSNIVGARFHGAKIKKEKNRHSESSSFDLSWLDPLPELPIENSQGISLPKFHDFKYIGRLGNGACAQVYCIQHILSEQYFAIKVADGTDIEARQQLEVEKYILFRYSHGNPYMIKVYCAFHQGNKLFLVMELVQGGTLCHKIQTTRMNEDEIRYYLAQIICVIQYLHSNNIVYRDLKLEHAIVCSTGSIRLIDYGLARILKASDETCHTFCGTYSYMAPEVRCLEKNSSDKGYSFAVDFWALGIMFVQMLCGEKIDFDDIFANNNENTTEPIKITQYLELPRYISLEAHSCVIGLLENDPEKRLGSPNSPHGSIRDHPFFKAGHRINWSEIDEGVFKPCHKNSENIRVMSDTSCHQSLPTLQLDRGGHAKDDWIAAGKSTCTSDENERLKSFNYINSSSCLEFTQSDFL